MKVFVGDVQRSCTGSSYYTTQIFNFLRMNGVEVVKDGRDADYIIIVTCGGNTDNEDLSLKIINDYICKYQYQKNIIVTGCLPRINPSALDVPGLTVIPFWEVEELNRMFGKRIKIQDVKANKLNKNIAVRDPEEYHVRICQGCVNSCSFCVIKKAKGHVRSEPISKIIDEIKEGVALGYKKIVLLADDCGSYGLDIGTDFTTLLNEIESLGEDIKLTIYYIYPQKIVELFEGTNEKIWSKVSFVLVPLQSTSDRILKLMNRDYNVDDILDTLEKIKRINPDIYLVTHIIVGFPQETDEEALPKKRMEEIFDEIVLHRYSDREGTRAYSFDCKLSEEDIMDRLKMVNAQMSQPQKINLANEVKLLELDGSDSKEALKENRFYIKKFCRKYGYRLKKTAVKLEDGRYRPACIFDDDSGLPYSIRDIKEHLD